ncbi:MAG: class I SAM-dependent methyltransferase [Caldilineaceae bacterium]|nr:class I SAM-dependent methyltransferase [Caldilineaceae bacterium]
MNFYEDPEQAEAYVQMAVGYDGRELIARLRQHLPDGATVLELGIGPGVDLDLLAVHFRATGSDRSAYFVERYRQQNPAADLLILDAVTLETDRRFDAIYSNKVLHHLTRQELRLSLARQAQLLNPGGLALHSFWAGDGEEEMMGMRFVYYTPETLAEQVGGEWTILESTFYVEMEENDSLLLLLRRGSGSSN